MQSVLDGTNAVIEAEEKSRLTGLDFLWLELTGKCNLRCVHCYAGSGPELPLQDRMRLSDWRKALDEARALRCRKVQFIGGEVTLHPDLAALIEHAYQRDFTHIEVFTNGTTFPTSLRKAFSEFRVKLAFSVYSADAATHDAVTLRAGSLDRTLASIVWAVEEGLSVRVAIVDFGNDAAMVSRTVARLREIGVADVQTDKVRGVGRGAPAPADVNTVDELCGRCWQGKLCVTPSGVVFPCVFSRAFPVGRFEDGLASVVRGDALTQFRNRVHAISSATDNACHPQCGPDCAPSTCGPQSCRPSGG